MPKYNDKDIVDAIKSLRDILYELVDPVHDEAKEDKGDKLKKLSVDIKKIELVRKGN